MKKFKPALFIMKPRHIEAVVESIDNNIDIDTFFFQKFTEKQVCITINKIIKDTDYTHYIISADDIIYDRDATQEVLRVSEQLYKENKIEVVTGWCNLCFGCSFSNVCLEPLTLKGSFPQKLDYNFVLTKNLHERYKDQEIFTTYLSSFCFSCIPRKIIIEYPMKAYQNNNIKYGCCSDHYFSHSFYSKEKRGFLTNTKMFFTHLKQHESHPFKSHWIKKGKPQIIKFK